MKKRNKIIALLCIIILAIVILIRIFYCDLILLYLSYIIPPYVKISDVDKNKWDKIKIGMTKEEIKQTMGVDVEKGNDEILKNENGEISSETVEYWLYGYIENPRTLKIAMRAYVIIFNEKGIVISFREPLQYDKIPPAPSLPETVKGKITYSY